jgi:hypothetical protein
MRVYTRHKEPITCECGVKLKCGTGLAQHKRSLLHCHASRLRALLDTCLNFSVIGRRLGITRERVRQLASSLGYKPGVERRTLCRLKRREDEAIERPMILALRQSCPYPLELIRLPRAKDTLRYFATEVIILGRRCVIHKASYQSKGTIHFNYSRGYHSLCEFSLVLIPDGRWLVCQSRRSGNTCFKLGARRMPGRTGAFHGWNDLIGA